MEFTDWLDIAGEEPVLETGLLLVGARDSKDVRRWLQAVAWEQAVDDVRPFLDSSGDAGLLTAENLKRVLD